MSEDAILALINSIPAIFQVVQQFTTNNKISDVTTMKAALAAAQTSANTDFTQLLADMSEKDQG